MSVWFPDEIDEWFGPDPEDRREGVRNYSEMMAEEDEVCPDCGQEYHDIFGCVGHDIPECDNHAHGPRACSCICHEDQRGRGE